MSDDNGGSLQDLELGNKIENQRIARQPTKLVLVEATTQRYHELRINLPAALGDHMQNSPLGITRRSH